MIIAVVENAIIAACQARLGSAVREVKSLPTGLSAGELEERMRAAPGVYVAFLGGTFKDEASAVLDARFGVFFLAQTGGDESLARLGTLQQIGAYRMFERCLPVLHGLKTDWGTLSAKEFNNLFSAEIDKRGLALYSVSFSLPVTFSDDDNISLEKFQAAFLQYTDDADQAQPPIPVPAGETIAQDIVAIPQS
jgi:phage gp37-like protein